MLLNKKLFKKYLMYLLLFITGYLTASIINIKEYMNNGGNGEEGNSEEGNGEEGNSEEGNGEEGNGEEGNGEEGNGEQKCENDDDCKDGEICKGSGNFRKCDTEESTFLSFLLHPAWFFIAIGAIFVSVLVWWTLERRKYKHDVNYGPSN